MNKEHRAPDRPAPPADSAAAIGLLPYLTAHAMDDDYAHVAKHGPGPRNTRWWTLVVVAAFVVLVLTAASQTNQNAGTDQSDRGELIAQIKQRQAEADKDRAQVAELRAQITKLRSGMVDNDQLSSGTRAQLRRLGALTGALPVTGEGVQITVDDKPGASTDQEHVLDLDLQRLVNGLWLSGAEAIAINGQRLTNLTSIRQAGSAITVGYRALERPYVVSAIGDAATLPGRFADTTAGQAWLDLHQQVGLEFALVAKDSMVLPAARTTTLRHAEEDAQ